MHYGIWSCVPILVLIIGVFATRRMTEMVIISSLIGSVIIYHQHFFTGFVDLIYQDKDGALCILDHKSRALKPRSGRKNPTKTDLELDDYLRQLYLYSIPISKLYGRYPDFLEFNCYRTDVRIKEPFQMEVLDHTKKWALDTIDAIRNEESWKPNIDFWRCKYLCPFHDSCEYAEMATE